MENNKTAVQLALDEVYKEEGVLGVATMIPRSKMATFLRSLLLTEKQQIKDAFIAGKTDDAQMTSDEYYSQTYKTEKDGE